MLSKNLEVSLNNAFDIAKGYGHEFATLEHLLLSLIDNKEACDALKSCGANIDLLRRTVRNFVVKELDYLVVRELSDVRPTNAFQRVIHRAAVQASKNGDLEITGVNILMELFGEKESYAVYFLNKQNITLLDIVNYHSRFYLQMDMEDPNQFEMLISRPVPKKVADDAANQSAPHSGDKTKVGGKARTSADVVQKYCIDLKARAKMGKISPAIGRDEEIERSIHILSRLQKNNPLFVGDPGVGKTAIAEGIAHRIIKDEVPEMLHSSEIYSLDLGSLVAGTRYRGDFEDRLKKLMEYFRSNERAILFIDEIHTLVGTGVSGNSALDASNILKPALARGEIRCIGATTFEEYNKFFSKDKALARRFQKVEVAEPSAEETIEILTGIKERFETYHNIKYRNEAIQAAVNLSQRYIHDRKLPDKAIDVMDEVGAQARIRGKQFITQKDVEQIIAEISSIPSKSVNQNEIASIKTLENTLKKEVMGQDGAIEQIVTTIKVSKAGLRDKNKPMASFLFYGPTGIGKTEMAKKIAQHMNMNFIRFDMSEYLEMHAVSKLIGSPPGYVGYEEGGLMTNKVERHPYSLVLLDEVEKAHPDVYNILLQIMDYGTLTDNNGKQVNFRNCIIIMTSNVGAEMMGKETVGFTGNQACDNLVLKEQFSPEFRSRLDAMIQFQPLSEECYLRIIESHIKQICEHVEDKVIEVTCNRAAKKQLLKIAQSRSEGVREIDKVISEYIKKELVDEILFGRLLKGGKVRVDYYKAADKFAFEYEV
jgi:ATP-dependent Clp protease ATP-binding subunit ClpA